LLGFGGFFLSGTIAGFLIAILSVVRRDARLGAIALLGIAGVLRATAASGAVKSMATAP
jgi:hypothetical protein